MKYHVKCKSEVGWLWQIEYDDGDTEWFNDQSMVAFCIELIDGSIPACQCTASVKTNLPKKSKSKSKSFATIATC